MVKKDWHHKIHHNVKKHMLEVSMRNELITLEEGLLLIVGVLFGWLAGKGMPAILILIPVALFVTFILDLMYKGVMKPKIKKEYQVHIEHMRKVHHMKV